MSDPIKPSSSGRPISISQEAIPPIEDIEPGLVQEAVEAPRLGSTRFGSIIRRRDFVPNGVKKLQATYKTPYGNLFVTGHYDPIQRWIRVDYAELTTWEKGLGIFRTEFVLSMDHLPDTHGRKNRVRLEGNLPTEARLDPNRLLEDTTNGIGIQSRQLVEFFLHFDGDHISLEKDLRTAAKLPAPSVPSGMPHIREVIFREPREIPPEIIERISPPIRAPKVEPPRVSLTLPPRVELPKISPLPLAIEPTPLVPRPPKEQPTPISFHIFLYPALVLRGLFDQVNQGFTEIEISLFGIPLAKERVQIKRGRVHFTLPFEQGEKQFQIRGTGSKSGKLEMISSATLSDEISAQIIEEDRYIKKHWVRDLCVSAGLISKDLLEKRAELQGWLERFEGLVKPLRDLDGGGWQKPQVTALLNQLGTGRHGVIPEIQALIHALDEIDSGLEKHQSNLREHQGHYQESLLILYEQMIPKYYSDPTEKNKSPMRQWSQIAVRKLQKIKKNSEKLKAQSREARAALDGLSVKIKALGKQAKAIELLVDTLQEPFDPGQSYVGTSESKRSKGTDTDIASSFKKSGILPPGVTTFQGPRGSLKIQADYYQIDSILGLHGEIYNFQRPTGLNSFLEFQVFEDGAFIPYQAMMDSKSGFIYLIKWPYQDPDYKKNVLVIWKNRSDQPRVSHTTYDQMPLAVQLKYEFNFYSLDSDKSDSDQETYQSPFSSERIKINHVGAELTKEDGSVTGLETFELPGTSNVPKTLYIYQRPYFDPQAQKTISERWWVYGYYYLREKVLLERGAPNTPDSVRLMAQERKTIASVYLLNPDMTREETVGGLDQRVSFYQNGRDRIRITIKHTALEPDIEKGLGTLGVFGKTTQVHGSLYVNRETIPVIVRENPFHREIYYLPVNHDHPGVYLTSQGKSSDIPFLNQFSRDEIRGSGLKQGVELGRHFLGLAPIRQWPLVQKTAQEKQYSWVFQGNTQLTILATQKTDQVPRKFEDLDIRARLSPDGPELDVVILTSFLGRRYVIGIHPNEKQFYQLEHGLAGDEIWEYDEGWSLKTQVLALKKKRAEPLPKRGTREVIIPAPIATSQVNDGPKALLTSQGIQGNLAYQLQPILQNADILQIVSKAKKPPTRESRIVSKISTSPHSLGTIRTALQHRLALRFRVILK